MALSDLQKMVVGMFSQPQAPAGASIYDQARADAQRQALAQLGMGLVGAAVPQTPTMRAQALQQAFGGLGNVGTNIYNSAQARLMAQQVESAAARDRALAARVAALRGGNAAQLTTPGIVQPAPATAPQVTDTSASNVPATPVPLSPAAPQLAAPQPPSANPLQFTAAEQARLDNALVLGDEEYIKAYNEIVKEKSKPASAAKPESDIAKLRSDLANGIISKEEFDRNVAIIGLSPREKALQEKYATAQFEFESAGVNAPIKLARLDTLDTLLEQAKTGQGAVPRNWLTNFMSTFGVTDEQLAQMGLDKNATITGEAATALINQMTMGNIGPGGIPAQNFSNADLKFALGANAQISNLPQANKIIVEIERGKIQAQVDAMKAWKEYKKKYGQNADFMEWQTEYQLSLNESGKSYFEGARKLIEEAQQPVETGPSPSQEAQPQLRDGAVVKNPNTGDRLLLVNGKWIPIPRDFR